MRILMSEWHSVEKRYAAEIDEETINAIYLDATVDEIEEIVRQLIAGELNVSTVIEDSLINNVSIDFEWLDEDDWWTDRKGGYDVTYAIDEDSVSDMLTPTFKDLQEDADERARLAELKAEFDRLVVEEELVKPKRKSKKKE